MKKIFKILSLGLILCNLIFISCEKDGEIKTEVEKQKITQNLLKYTDSFLKNNIEIISLLSKNKDLKFNDDFIGNLEKCKTENEVISLFYKSNVKNSSELISQIKIGIELTNNFKNENHDFYRYDEITRKKLLEETLEVSFASANRLAASRSCYEQWQVDVSRCNRNFAIAGTVAVVSAGFTVGLGGLIGGAGAATYLWFCKSDSLDDYNDCIDG